MRKTIPKENFPQVSGNSSHQKRYIVEDLVISWISTVYRKRKGEFFNLSVLLIMDSVIIHINDNVKNM